MSIYFPYLFGCRVSENGRWSLGLAVVFVASTLQLAQGGVGWVSCVGDGINDVIPRAGGLPSVSW